MAKHLDYIKSASSVPSLSSIISDIIRFKNGDTLEKTKLGIAYVTSLRSDHVMINDTVQTITRVFVTAPDSGSYSYVGWTLACDVTHCMTCSSQFGIFNIKHHCRSCGNVVCNNCSTPKATIIEISSQGPMKICKDCFSGRSLVTAVHNDTKGVQIEIYAENKILEINPSNNTSMESQSLNPPNIVSSTVKLMSAIYHPQHADWSAALISEVDDIQLGDLGEGSNDSKSNDEDVNYSSDLDEDYSLDAPKPLAILKELGQSNTAFLEEDGGSGSIHAFASADLYAITLDGEDDEKVNKGNYEVDIVRGGSHSFGTKGRNGAVGGSETLCDETPVKKSDFHANSPMPMPIRPMEVKKKTSHHHTTAVERSRMSMGLSSTSQDENDKFRQSATSSIVDGQHNLVCQDSDRLASELISIRFGDFQDIVVQLELKTKELETVDHTVHQLRTELSAKYRTIESQLKEIEQLRQSSFRTPVGLGKGQGLTPLDVPSTDQSPRWDTSQRSADPSPSSLVEVDRFKKLHVYNTQRMETMALEIVNANELVKDLTGQMEEVRVDYDRHIEQLRSSWVQEKEALLQMIGKLEGTVGELATNNHPSPLAIHNSLSSGNVSLIASSSTATKSQSQLAVTPSSPIRSSSSHLNHQDLVGPLTSQQQLVQTSTPSRVPSKNELVDIIL